MCIVCDLNVVIRLASAYHYLAMKRSCFIVAIIFNLHFQVRQLWIHSMLANVKVNVCRDT